MILFTTVSPAALHAAQPAKNKDYEAQIRWTRYGIPHITAKDFGSLAFGEGYAFAKDHLGSLLDQVIKVRGERARYFGAGAGDRHLNSDITFRALGFVEQAKALFPKLSQENRETLEGYAAGINAYRRENQASCVVSVAHWGLGSDWLFDVTPLDILAYNQSVIATTPNLGDLIATATPPKSDGSEPVAEGLPIPECPQASNGWALGSARSAQGGGMLMANPHFPWTGAFRFWEKHLTIPGKLNVYGVSLLGIPGVLIGFNDAVAWTHTVSAGKRFVFYTLDLVPGHPTRYYYDGKERELTVKHLTFEVRQPDGSLKKVERELYSSHYGPMVNVAGFEWSAKRGVCVRDANANNTQFYDQRLAMNQAKSMVEFQQAHARYNAVPWVNTIAASADGRAWFADTSATPYLSPAATAAFTQRLSSDFLAKVAWQRGVALFDGSKSANEWQNDPTTRPGVLPYSKMPQQERRDYVFNANDSYWLTNPSQPLTGFSPLQGDEATARSLRTRMNALVLEGTQKFSLDTLAAAAINNRSLSAELLRGELAARAKSAGSVVIDGKEIDLRAASQVLAAWDGKYNTDSVGAVLWREFISLYSAADTQKAGALFQNNFDPKQPVTTPSVLAAPKDGTDTALVNLGRAVLVLKSAGIALETPLGKLQYSDKRPGRIPIHGGDGALEGLTNVVGFGSNRTSLEPFASPASVIGSRSLTKDGYLINQGSSFMMALEFTKQGPKAVAVLTYSQSGDPRSPHFSDQTALFGAKQWRPILFTEKEIKADTALIVLKVHGKRP